MPPSGLQNWSQTAATNASADSNINWTEGQPPSSINDSARAMMAVLAKWRDDNNGSLTTGGTTTALTITSNTVFTTLALMHNQTLAFTMNATSGATPTLNVDGLGAKVIRNATGVALPTGALLSGSVYHATYNNTSGEWLLHNQPGVLPAGTVGGTFGVTGDFSVNTNKFTVTASSGNTLVAGTFTSTGAGTFSSTLSAVGDFAINTNKFNVTAASGNTAIAGTLNVTGLSTVVNLQSTAAIVSNSPTSGIGYNTGAGGTVSQTTDKSTAVTLNKICGQITTQNTAISAGSRTSFLLNNSTITATDRVDVWIVSGNATPGTAIVTSTNVTGGACAIAISNISAGSQSEALVIGFQVIKSVTS